MTPTSVRPATEDDLVPLLSLGEAMHAESSYAHMPYSPEATAATLIGLLENPDSLIAVATDGHSITGVLLARVTSGYFTTARLAEDLALYVRPQDRGSTAATMLMRHYLAWAQGRGVRRIELANGAGTDDTGFARLGAFFGLRRVGSILYREIDP